MKKTWSWSVTGFAMTDGLEMDEIIQICSQAGLAGIEGVRELILGLDEGDLLDLRARFAQAGLVIDSFHLPYEEDIAAFYESDRRRAVATTRRWMEAAAALGARVGVQHPTTNRYRLEVEDFEQYLRQLDRSLQELLPAAQSLDFTLSLENMLPPRGGFGFATRPEHFERFQTEFEHSNLGFCLDTGHALVALGLEGPGAFFEVMAPRLAAFHLADNPGDRDSHLAPGRGRVDWRTVFRRMAELEYRHPACMEVRPFAPGPPYQMQDWAGLVSEAEALAQAALR